MTNESQPPLTAAFESLARLVDGARSVLVGTHLNPDGDAIGSALAVSLWLESRHVPHQVVCHNAPPGYLAFLSGAERVDQTVNLDHPDLGIVVDLDSLDRLGSLRPVFESLPHLALIDHHQPHEMAGDLRIVDSQAPATASILVDLFQAGKAEVSPAMADCLLTGLVTDTGSFRFPNTTAHALHQAAWLVEKGASLSRVSDEVYLNRDEPAVRILGAAIGRMQMACQGQLAWTVLTPEMFDEFGAREEHTEGIVNEILSVRSVRAAFLIRQGLNGKVKGSLRSKGDVDVSKVAREIGGGGHKNAAGVTVVGTLAEAENLIVEALSQCLASC